MNQEEYLKAYIKGYKFGVSLFATELTLKLQEMEEDLLNREGKKGE